MRAVLPRRALLAAPALLPAAARAQAWPTKPVRIVVPYETGGPTDAITRLVGNRLAETLGQPFVVENRGGSGTVIGTALVARAEPDGHVLLVGTAATSGNATLQPRLPFDTLRDLSAIVPMAITPYFLTAHAGVPAATVPELLAHLRANPGAVSYASSGIGSGPHLTGEMLKLQAGVQMEHVPYRGTAPAITDLLAGRVGLYFTSLSASLPHLRTGQLKVLGVASRERSPFLPEVATMQEAGLRDFEAESWFGLMGPAGVPEAVEARLAAAVNAALDVPEVRQRLADLVHLPMRQGPAEFKAWFRRDVERWATVIRAANVTPG